MILLKNNIYFYNNFNILLVLLRILLPPVPKECNKLMVLYTYGRDCSLYIPIYFFFLMTSTTEADIIIYNKSLDCYPSCYYTYVAKSITRKL